jgi:protein TonB
MEERTLFSGTFMNQPSLLRRLSDELVEASREFRENPKEYLRSAFKSDGLGGHRRKMLLRFGLALGIVVYAIVFAVILVMWSFSHAKATAANEQMAELRVLLSPDDLRIQDVQMPKDTKKAGGGGGGGRNTPTPPSKGQLPKFSLQPPIIAPRPEPQLKPPSLPVPETVQVDPRLEPKRDELAPTGLPTGVAGPPSPGPGSGGGMGTGSGGGMGPGSGTGVGPGYGWNMGGNGPSLGGRPGSGETTAVDTKPIPLNKPRPNYTEEARKNKVQGVVLLRVVIGPDGTVKSARVIRGLPDGLNEEAIRAAYQMRFKPAMKNGQPVAFPISIEVEFNLR